MIAPRSGKPPTTSPALSSRSRAASQERSSGCSTTRSCGIRTPRRWPDRRSSGSGSMARARDSARTFGTRDPVAARAVVHAARCEPGLPIARLDGPPPAALAPMGARSLPAAPGTWPVAAPAPRSPSRPGWPVATAWSSGSPVPRPPRPRARSEIGPLDRALADLVGSPGVGGGRGCATPTAVTIIGETADPRGFALATSTPATPPSDITTPRPCPSGPDTAPATGSAGPVPPAQRRHPPWPSPRLTTARPLGSSRTAARPATPPRWGSATVTPIQLDSFP